MSFRIILPTAILIAVGIFAYSKFQTQWSLFYYPNGCLTCTDKYVVELNFYESREQCRDSGFNRRKLGGNYTDTFECGSNCKQKGEIYVCKETVDF